MKKTTILIITIISLIVFLIGSFLFVKKARENRTWPFNSTLSNYFPVMKICIDILLNVFDEKNLKFKKSRLYKDTHYLLINKYF